MKGRIIEDSAAVKAIMITAALIADNNRRQGASLSATQWAGLVRFVKETTDKGFHDADAVTALYLIASGQQAYALPVNSESPQRPRMVKS